MSKNIDLSLASSLEALGLTDKEALVYLALVQSREVSAVTIAKLTGLHRQFVYNALATLLEKELVLKLGTSARALWRAQTPRKFIALAEEAERRAQRVTTELLALVEKGAGQEFSVTEGIRAFRDRLLDTMRAQRPDSTILMLCGQWDRYFAHIGTHTHEQWEKLRLKKNISFRIIGPRVLHSELKDDSLVRPLTSYRVFPGLEENMVNTVIYPDRIDYEIYSDTHLTFSLKEPAVVASQARFFEALWQKSDVV